MLDVDGVLVSEDVAQVEFACHLAVCKGACCIEGELGAPLEQRELPIMDGIADAVKPYLSPAGVQAITRQGNYVLDEEGDFSTPTVSGKECAYAVYASNGVLQCGIEKAYLAGKITFRKPMSCHLYPIRILKVGDREALNYHEWSVCSSACEHGKALKVPLYVFLRVPLIRKYGTKWYEKLLSLLKAR